MRYRYFIATLLFAIATALPLFAQQPPIEHVPVDCLPARRNSVMFASTDAKGEPRLYFRRLGATEWCYVEGARMSSSLRAILPQFEPDIDIEHFFITVQEEEVTARSPRIYRVKVQNRCDTLVARGVDFILNNCDDGPGDLGSAVAAGYALQSETEPPEISPFTPEN